jgi:LCP family protein required for cell wall assembly
MNPELPQEDTNNRSTRKKVWLGRGLLVVLVISTAFASVRLFKITRAIVSGDITIIDGPTPVGGDPGAGGDTLPPTLVPVPVVELEPWDGSSRVTILLLGLDFRDWALGQEAPLSDTMMLLTLDPNSGTGGILSIPRDLWVSIPGYGHAKINTAYKLGESAQLPGRGPGLATATIEQLLGIKIHYFAQIEFGAFVHFIDTIGCVKLDIPEPIKIDVLDTPWPITLDAGTSTLCGNHALAYARARNTEGGDFDRAQRQQQVVLAMRDQMMRRDVQTLVISNALAIYQDIISGIQTNMSFEEAFKLGLLALDISLDNLTVDAIGAEHVLLDLSPTGLEILKPIPSKIRILRDQIFSPEASISPALLDLTPAELMQAEGASVAIYNGTLTNGLAGDTRDYLVSLGVNIPIADTATELQTYTKIIDHTGNPYTMKFLIELMGIQKNRIFYEYDPDSAVDIEIILGSDWYVP